MMIESLTEPQNTATTSINRKATVLTPPGRGAVATIVLQGKLAGLEERAAQAGVACFQSKNRKCLADQALHRICFGAWGAEELIVCRTALETLEIHSHGGISAVNRILSDLTEAGVHVQEWPDFLEETTGIWEVEYVQALSRARTPRVAELLLHQRVQGISFWEKLSQDLHKNGPCEDHSSSSANAARELSHRWANFGMHLTNPWKVVIGGQPNVGKSSLINALLGYERAIVVDQPGTTRDVVSGETALEGWPMLFSDTAGQRVTEDELEAAGIDLAVQTMQQADLVLLLFDQHLPPDEQTLKICHQFPDSILILNKSDLVRHADWDRLPLTQAALTISSRSGSGLPELMRAIVQRLIPELPPEGVVYPVSPHQLMLLEQWGNRENTQNFSAERGE